MADIQGRGKADLIVGALWSRDGEWFSGALIIRIEGKELKVAGRLFERSVHPTPEGIVVPPIARLSSADLDNDGRDEVFAIGPVSSNVHRMVRWAGNTLQEDKAPFAELYIPTIAWLDYDGDGWVDLYLAGAKAMEGEPRALLQVAARIYHNDKGDLTKTGITVGADHVVNSAHVLDFDEDGKPDLLLTGASSSIMHPNFSRVFLNRVDRFEEVELPLRGMDKLIGLDRAAVATGDLDGDGLADILMAGNWADFGPKSTISLLFKKARDPRNHAYHIDYDRERIDQIPDINGQFTIVDLDGDGDNDLLAMGRGRDFKHRVICLENVDGALIPLKSGPWAKNPDQPLGEAFGWTVIPWDVNGDDLLDVVGLPGGSGGRPTVLVNTSKR